MLVVVAAAAALDIALGVAANHTGALIAVVVDAAAVSPWSVVVYQDPSLAPTSFARTWLVPGGTTAVRLARASTPGPGANPSGATMPIVKNKRHQKAHHDAAHLGRTTLPPRTR